MASPGRPVGIRINAMTLYPAFLQVFAAAAAFMLLVFPSKAATDLLIWGAFLWSLPRYGRASAIWTSPPGLCAILVALYPLFMAPWSQSPAASLQDLGHDLRLPALAFALSVLATDLPGVLRTLRIAVLALLPVFAFDILRLAILLGPELLAQARYYKPYALNHPNVSSVLAGAACLVCLHGLWDNRRRPWALAAFAAAGALSLAYLVIMASRGPQAAFAATLFMAFLLAPRTWKGRLAGILLALAAALLVGTHLKTVNARFLDKTDLFSGREVVWRHTSALIARRPWIGHGYGKKVFQEVYAASRPPPSPHFFPHPHQYALFVLFQGGRAWLILHAALWLLLALRLKKALTTAGDPARMGVVLVSLLLGLWLVYGLGDYPDNRLQIGLVALIPLALAAARREGVRTSES